LRAVPWRDSRSSPSQVSRETPLRSRDDPRLLRSRRLRAPADRRPRLRLAGRPVFHRSSRGRPGHLRIGQSIVLGVQGSRIAWRNE
jgi:hypothetical protein